MIEREARKLAREAFAEKWAKHFLARAREEITKRDSP